MGKVALEEQFLNLQSEFKKRVGEAQACSFIRDRGLEFVEKIGWPNRHQESWKYTKLTELSSNPDLRISVSSPNIIVSCQDSRVRVMSLKEGLTRGLIDGRTTSELTDFFDSLNLAFFDEGVVVQIPPNIVVENPIEIQFINDGNSASSEGLTVPSGDLPSYFPRIIYLIGNGSKASIVESFVGSKNKSYLMVPSSEVYCGANSNLELVRLQRESVNATHLGSTKIEQAEGSNLKHLFVSLGASLSRQTLSVCHQSHNSHSLLLGLYSLHSTQHSDHQTFVDFVKGHASCDQVYKGVLDDQSRAVFNGRVLIRPNSAKSAITQVNKNRLLSSQAEVDTKPMLEIYNDDVKATHGAAIGQINTDELFYLLSRGISEDRAKAILTTGFLLEVIDPIENIVLKSVLLSSVQEWIERKF